MTREREETECAEPECGEVATEHDGRCRSCSSERFEGEERWDWDWDGGEVEGWGSVE